MKKVFVFAFVFLTLFFTSCTEELNSSVQYVKINELESGEIPEIFFVQSEKENPEMRDEEIKKQIEENITGNKKILVIKTVYKGNYLFRGEIIFVPTKEESKLKIKFISSKERFPKTKDRKIEESLKKELSQTDGIKAVQTIYNSGYLIGVEIYY